MKNRMISILIVLIVLLSGAVSASGEDRPKPSWTWTEENPKPAWFTWGKEYWPEEPVRGGYIKLAAASYIGLMNPNQWPVNDWNQMTMMYDMMINNIGDYRAKAYMLAESLEYTSPTTVVMKLRKGVQFHDGTDFNAESLKYQLEWIKDRKNGAWSRAWLEPLESVDIIDEYTVQFNTKEIWAGLPGVCTGAPFYAISREALKKDNALKEVQRLEGSGGKGPEERRSG